METLQLREEFYWTGIVDDQLRVFDIIMYTSLEQLIILIF